MTFVAFRRASAPWLPMIAWVRLLAPVTPAESLRCGDRRIMGPMVTGNWHAKHHASLTAGQRAADALRNSMGSWPFIGCFIAVMLLWAFANSAVLHDEAWDPYPYILLNLFLSMLAGLQGAILLIAAKRQDAINAAMAQHDYDTNTAAKAEIDRLIELCEHQGEMMAELHQLVKRIPAGNGPDSTLM